MQISALTPVECSIEVPLAPEQAFAVFTADFGRWWPSTHHIGANPFTDAVIEPFRGGRWYERDAAGAECDWGRVLAWEPPDRLVLSWALTCRFTPEPDPAQASEVEIRFTGTGTGTRIDLQHRDFEKHGGGGEQLRTGVGGPNGWPACLSAYRTVATGGSR